jgi:hypothetical protein
MEPEGSLPCSQEPPNSTPFVIFRSKLIFQGDELLDPRPTPQTGGPPLVGCPRLLIQYNRSYPPYLEAASSIRNWGRDMPWWRGTLLTWIQLKYLKNA